VAKYPLVLDHIGISISGNEKADTAAAKAALSLSVTPMKLPTSEFFPRVNKLISEIGKKLG